MSGLLPNDIKMTNNELMSKHTSIGVGGPADCYAEAQSSAQLHALLQHANQNSMPVFFLGAGSNLLVSDLGIEGLVIRLRGEFESIDFNKLEVRAGAGVFLPILVKKCAENGLSGMEPLIGIPGTVGGALIMNAGTRDLEIGEVVRTVGVLQSCGKIQILPAEEIQFMYRSSSLSGKIICCATFQLKAANKDGIMRTIQIFLSNRLQTQPIGTLNLGSIFKNPEGNYAGTLIEKAGLKGLKKGGAQVSPKHANFIVNNGGATARDVKDLVLEIQKIVKEKFQVSLETEIKMVGR